MVFFRQFQHLLPKSEAWKLAVGGTLRKLFEGLAGAPAALREFADNTFLDIFPDTTRELSAYEEQFGLKQGATDEVRIAAVEAAWTATGGQSPRYLQDVLQKAGFDVYVHEWWSSGPAPYVPRDPRAYTNQPLVGTVQCAPDAWAPQCKLSTTTSHLAHQCNDFLANRTYYLVNKDLSNRAPPPIPSDPAKWPFFMYVGGATFGDYAYIAEPWRMEELERLILKYRPTNAWIVMLIEPSEVFDESFDDSFN